tara:strand:- start:334 stop:828 length:495 start_codon:yes stop_codon:yes gene_type:complete
MEKFNVYLDSADAIDGTNPERTTFNMGSIYNFAPNLHKYANQDYCFVKVANFSIKYSASQANTDDVSNILVSINSALPNSATNTLLADGSISTQTGVIANIPTGATNYTYSNVDYDNEMVKCSNIFKGNLQIELLDQMGQLLDSELSSANPWKMTLCVYFENIL